MQAILSYVALGTAILFGFGVPACHGEGTTAKSVQIRSAMYPPTPFQIRRAKRSGKKLVPEPGLALTGHLLQPTGTGPFPAVVLLHGCNGTGRWNQVWSERLVEWGYVVLEVDSFKSRKFASVCGREAIIAGPTRALDAHGARAYLAHQPFVDSELIAVMGMSHGGWAVLNAVNAATTARLMAKPFRAAIALYPWCAGPSDLDAPLLILTGSLDDWTPARKCETLLKGLKSNHELVMETFKNAHHMFDLEGLEARQHGHILRYNAEAATAATKLIKAFLAKYLAK